MTTQATDLVLWEELEYRLLGNSGGPLFDPKDQGLRPISVMSANWRGFVCRYAVRAGSLRLDWLLFNTRLERRRAENAPTVFGRRAEVAWHDDIFRSFGLDWLGLNSGASEMARLLYEDLDVPMAYTGGLLLAKDWVKEAEDLPRHCQRISHYSDVREVILLDGRVTHQYERSSEIAAIRSQMLRTTNAEWSQKSEQFREQITRSLSAAYDYRY
jgi:hypothetical protein